MRTRTIKLLSFACNITDEIQHEIYYGVQYLFCIIVLENKPMKILSNYMYVQIVCSHFYKFVLALNYC